VAKCVVFSGLLLPSRRSFDHCLTERVKCLFAADEERSGMSTAAMHKRIKQLQLDQTVRGEARRLIRSPLPTRPHRP
jgi:hypothetical protein